MPAETVDLAFADPPFNIGYDYDVYNDQQEREAYLRWSREWIAGVYRALKPTGTFWLAIGDEYAAELKVTAQEVGFHCRSWVVWYYTFGVNCKYKFSRSHAHLFHFTKDPAEFTFNGPSIRVPSARQLVYGDSRAAATGRLPDDTWILRPQDLPDGFSVAEDTWYFPRVAGTFKERAGFHGCQMPEQLLGRIIRACSNPDELVLDPFSGSGTTLVVARKLGRDWLGFELSEDYATRGLARVEAARRGDPLEGAPEPQVSAPATPTDPTLTRAKQISKSKNVIKVSPQKEAKLLAAQQAQQQAADQMREAVLAAFQETNSGWSVDRVLADPELHRPLWEACSRRGAAGDARSWSHLLFRLRHAGQLGDITPTQHAEMNWEQCDPFLYAVDIALAEIHQQMTASTRETLTVEDLLCEPPLAEQLDLRAAEFAPGFSPFQYRWAALKLYKENKVVRTRAACLEAPRLSPVQPLSMYLRNDWSTVFEVPGAYLVSSDKQALYAGATLNLRARLSRQFGPAVLAQWTERGQELTLRLFPAEDDPVNLLAYQSLLVKKHKTLMNLQMPLK